MDLSFTKKQSKDSLVFTRYLYVKDEVELALLISILNKSEDALFWAYELYYSGFESELFDLIWQIYYEFFATLNPSFESYLLKKEGIWLKKENEGQTHIIVGLLIQNLLCRPFNFDIFMLKKCCSLFEIDMSYADDTEKITHMDDFRKNVLHWLKEKDYRSLAQWIINENKTLNLLEIYDTCLDVFELTKPKYLKEFSGIINAKPCIDKNVVLLSKIMMHISKKSNLKMGRNIYANIEPESIIPYETICGQNEIRHYRVLEKACICGIDDLKWLGLFKLKRSAYNLKERYMYKWLYYASFSPLWFKRIEQFGGIIDHTNESIIFCDDDSMETFYYLYGLEPDEQKVNVQNKCIMEIVKIVDWSTINDKYGKNRLFDIWKEELEEFDLEGIQYKIKN